MRSTRASRVTRSLAAGTLCVLVVAGVVRSRARPGSGHVAPAAGPRPSADARVRFEANHGQFDDRVSFAARGPGYGLFLTPDGATLTLQRRTRTAGSVRRAAAVDTAVLRMRVVGGQPVTPSASEPLLAVSNYFVGKDRSKWRVGVESFARVRYAAVRPGLDVVFHGSGERALEYDLVLAPRVDPSEVALVFQGADGTAVGPGGELVLRTRGGEIRQPPPVAYQEGAGTERTPVAARYVAQADGAIGFAVGPYDRERALVIDPILVYSTYLGGTDEDLALDIAVDGSGNVYVAGTTLSTNFPVVAAAQPIYGGRVHGRVRHEAQRRRRSRLLDLPRRLRR